MINKSRKALDYFDEDGSPYLIRDDERGEILRIPATRNLAHALQTNDADMVDFIGQCLELEPSRRFTAAEAIKHPFITKSSGNETRRI